MNVNLNDVMKYTLFIRISLFHPRVGGLGGGGGVNNSYFPADFRLKYSCEDSEIIVYDISVLLMTRSPSDGLLL